MHIEKAKKRIAKKAKMGFHGYPQLSIEYFGKTDDFASEVVVTLVLEEGAQAMEERFKSGEDCRQNETIQSALVKMIERSNAKSVVATETVSLI